jgi:uracil-DNA glycosylase
MTEQSSDSEDIDEHPIIISLANNIHDSWISILEEYFDAIKVIATEDIGNSRIHPPADDVWNAFTMPYDSIKVVIIGQDPYPSIGKDGLPVAHGYSFSCRYPNPPQPSLKTIFKELKRSIEGFKEPKHGDISAWKDQGILLLNLYLTMTPNSNERHEFWGNVMISIITGLSYKRKNVVFMLWGQKARSLKSNIDDRKHLILEAIHPSPMNSLRKEKFVGCNHFALCNEYLIKHETEPIDWNVEGS